MVTRKNSSGECLVRTSFFKNTFSTFIISKGHLVKSSPSSLLQFPSLIAMFPTSCLLLQNISMDIQVNLNIYLIFSGFFFFFQKIVVYICFSALWFCYCYFSFLINISWIYASTLKQKVILLFFKLMNKYYLILFKK